MTKKLPSLDAAYALQTSHGMPSGLSDTALLHTEQDFPAFRAVNAERMCEHVKPPASEADKALFSTAKKIYGRIRLSGLIELSSLCAHAHRAAHRLICDAEVAREIWAAGMGIAGSWRADSHRWRRPPRAKASETGRWHRNGIPMPVFASCCQFYNNGNSIVNDLFGVSGPTFLS